METFPTQLSFNFFHEIIGWFISNNNKVGLKKIFYKIIIFSKIDGFTDFKLISRLLCKLILNISQGYSGDQMNIVSHDMSSR